MKDKSFEEMYPIKHIQPLYNKERHFILKWHEDKGKQNGRISMFDEIVKADKKDQHQAPNSYFKTDKKTDLLNTDRMSQSLIMPSKRTFGKLKKGAKESPFDDVIKAEKKKVGPNHYKNVEAGVKMGQDRTGRYNGLSKTSTDQLMLVNHQKATALDTPQVGHYKPNLRLTEKLIPTANLNRHKGPQRESVVSKEKSPGPQTYQTEKKDERSIVSIKKKSISYSIGSPDRKANKQLERFIDHVQKGNSWKPPFTKYHYTADQKKKMLSSPPRLAHKR